MNLNYRPIKDNEISIFKQYAMNLYAEDAGGEPMDSAKMGKTIHFLRLNPQNGTIMSILLDSTYIGYAILINFWSNEYGGIVLHIDELYIDEKFRNRGIASHFIKFLIDSKFNGCKALFLEVHPDNSNALKLYKRLGFQTAENSTLKFSF